MMKNSYFCLGLLLITGVVHASEYASLKYNEVNLRAGPSERYPIRWVYKEKGYPLEVLDSFELWRQVKEKDGTMGWIHQNMLTKNRSVIITVESNLLKAPEANAKVIAVVQPGVIAQVNTCPEGRYCRLNLNYRDKKYTGWFLRSNLWGIDKNEIIE